MGVFFYFCFLLVLVNGGAILKEGECISLLLLASSSAIWTIISLLGRGMFGNAWNFHANTTKGLLVVVVVVIVVRNCCLVLVLLVLQLLPLLLLSSSAV